jgi:ATP-dependent RNA helicase SUPV3L1/SUV3
MNLRFLIDDVAVIDEIQMMRDPQRGWAWARALLGKIEIFSRNCYSFHSGLQAKEIHLCGESSTIRLVQELMVTTGDEVEIREYKRLTKLIYQDRALGNKYSFFSHYE